MKPRPINFEAMHTCEKSRGKIVCITMDALGVTRCGYCNQVVDYSRFAETLKSKISTFLKGKEHNDIMPNLRGELQEVIRK